MGSASKVSTLTLLNGAIATGAGTAYQPFSCDSHATYQAYGATSAGAGAATILIEVSNRDAPVAGTSVDWVTLATFSLTLGTTQVTDGTSSVVPWKWVRAKVTAISGTDATVSVIMGNRQ